MSLVTEKEMNDVIAKYMGSSFVATNCVLGMLSEVARIAVEKFMYGELPPEPPKPEEFLPLKTVGTPLYVEDLLEAIVLATNNSGYVSVGVINQCLKKLLPTN